MAKHQEELTFNPSGVEVDDIDSVDLGEHEFEVDMLEAQAKAEETSAEETTTEEDVVDDVSADAVEEESVEEETDTPEAVADEEPEVEEDEAPEAVDELADPTENAMIPRERLNQSNRKRQEEADRADEMAQRVATLEAQLNSKAEEAGLSGIDPAAIKDAAEKVLDGDTEAFSNILTEQFNKMQANSTIDRDALLEQATQNAINAVNQNAAQVERQAAADEWVGQYAALDVDNKDMVNEEALSEANMLINMYEEKGYAPAVAIERAVKAVAASYDLVSSKAAPVTKLEVPKVPKRKATRTINQPAVTGEGGASKTDSPAINAAEMSQDEWDALPESTRDQLLTG